MKLHSFLWLCLLGATPAMAGTQDSLDLNMLQAPTSPAATLLGISPSDIHRPTDPAGFMVSAQNAAQNFSVFPSSYAVDIAPAWLFFGRQIAYDDLKDGRFRNSVWQNLQLSAAYTNSQDSTGKNTTIGVSIKTSILRGRFTRKADSLVNAVNAMGAPSDAKRANIMAGLMGSDPILQNYRALQNRYRTNPDSSDKYMQLQTQRISQLNDSVYASLQGDYDKIKDFIKKIDIDRYGWKLDISAGVASDFPDQVFDSLTMNKAGAWLTGGYSTQSGFSTLGIVRYLYNPDKVYADENGIINKGDINTLDGGLRLLYDGPSSNFTLSGEAIYRSVLNKDNVNPTWRFTINADYELAPGKILTLAFGRNFDGTFNKDGNVIAAINFVMGFGNKLKSQQ